MDKFNKPSSDRASNAIESELNNSEFDELEEKVFKAYQKKQYEECLELLEESLKIDPNNTNQRIIQAMCWANLDINGEETYEMFQQIIAEEPNNSFAYYGMGFKNYSDGRLANAIPFLNRAIELNTTNAMQKAVELQQKATRFKEAICEGEFGKNLFYKRLQRIFSRSQRPIRKELRSKGVSNSNRRQFSRHQQRQCAKSNLGTTQVLSE